MSSPTTSPSSQPQPILIIGAGIVGLSTSLFLAHHNIPSIIIERHSSPSIHPRSRSINARTMEVYSRIGIAEQVREAGRNMRATGGIYRGASLRAVIGGMKTGPQVAEGKDGKVKNIGAWLLGSLSPHTGFFVTQDQLEPMLVRIAQARGVDIRFSTTCIASTLSQTASAVTVGLLDNQANITTQISTPYLIACDGASSPIRTVLGIPTAGPGKLGRMVNILFSASLGEFVRGREFSLCWVERTGVITHEDGDKEEEEEEVEVKGLFASIDNNTKWVFQLLLPPSDSDSDFVRSPDEYEKIKAKYSKPHCHKLVQIALGFPPPPDGADDDLNLQIVSVLPWEPSVRVAARMHDGRVFLAGDAAHQMPPWAGQGANTGVGDAWGLAWRVAFMLREGGGEGIEKGRGKAKGDKLLQTYTTERQPVAALAAAISNDAADERGVICTEKSMRNAVRVLRRLRYMSGHGYGCEGSEGVGSEQDDCGAGWLGGWSWRAWTLGSLGCGVDGRAGRRCPFVWVREGKATEDGQRKSVLDVLGKRFVILAGEEGDPWVDVAEEVGKELGMQIDGYRVGEKGDLVCRKGEWENAAGITRYGALLVRPDDVVVCRWRRGVGDSRGELMRGMKID
ncbi:hypothetical protein ACMFMF_009615 [Clarireedia jacksonii]